MIFKKLKRYEVYVTAHYGKKEKTVILGTTIAKNSLKAIKQVLSREDLLFPKFFKSENVYYCYFTKEIN